MLTKSQEKKFRSILKKVNVSEICQELNINARSIYRVLDGEGRKYDDLIIVVEKAKEIIAANKKKLQSL